MRVAVRVERDESYNKVRLRTKETRERKVKRREALGEQQREEIPPVSVLPKEEEENPLHRPQRG
jgi:hypothetical protein